MRRHHKYSVTVCCNFSLIQKNMDVIVQTNLTQACLAMEKRAPSHMRYLGDLYGKTRLIRLASFLLFL